MLSPVYNLAQLFSEQTNRCIFLTGKAGTGKTTFLRKLRENTPKQLAVVAPTGVAAINAGGTTLHALFQLPFSPFVPTDEARKNLISSIKMRAERRKVLYELEMLVIDEVSMVRADVLDAIDTLLRHFKHRPTVPFGGVQMIFIGDMFQLSPVVQDAEWSILHNYYQGPYFFQSKVLEQIQPIYIELDTIFRQQNEQFIEILNQVRNNKLTETNLHKLNSYYKPDFVNSEEDFHITLTTHNYKADKINTEELQKISGKLKVLKASISGEFYEKSFPAEQNLELKVGARVMFIKNDEQQPRRFYNGKIGVVKSFLDNTILITTEGQDIEIGQVVWKNIRYTTDEKTKLIQEEELGTFTQFPLRLAWAITIHKSQGLTFDKAIIDAGQAFASGQVYVALSRCRSLEGVVLLSKINASTLRNANEILALENQKSTVEELEEKLNLAKIDYETQLYASVFDYRNIIGQTERLIHFLKDHAAQFNQEAVPFLIDLKDQTNSLQQVGDRFRLQLQSILSEQNQTQLKERICAAGTYFIDKNKILTELIRLSPIRTDVKAHAKECNDSLKTIFGTLAQKTALMEGLQAEVSVEKYFDVRRNFFIPTFKIDAFAGTLTKIKANTDHPQLLTQLIALRNELCEEQNLPLYVVGGTDMLINIANKLPQTEKDLLRIKGMGKLKFNRFGQAILNVVNDYVETHNLHVKQLDISEAIVDVENIQNKKKKADKNKSTKLPKIDTKKLTFELYQAGKSISEIAEERNLASSTIVGHLYTFTRSGELNLDTFISTDKLNKASQIIASAKDGESKSVLLEDLLTQEERSFFFQWIREQEK